MALPQSNPIFVSNLDLTNNLTIQSLKLMTKKLKRTPTERLPHAVYLLRVRAPQQPCLIMPYRVDIEVDLSTVD